MPEYLAPGVYVEETSFRSKSIEGVSTSTAGFVGPARFGPVSGSPELITSLADFERIYGGLDDLKFTDQGEPQTNYLAHAVRAFFEEGGRRLYVSRAFNANNQNPPAHYASTDTSLISPPTPQITLRARFPGAAGNIRVTFTLQVGANALNPNPPGGNGPALTRVRNFDVVHIRSNGVSIQGDGLFVARWDSINRVWIFRGNGSALPLNDPANTTQRMINPTLATAQVRPLAVLVEIERPIVATGGFSPPELLGEFAFDPRSPSALDATFTRSPLTRLLALTIPFALEIPEDIRNLNDEAEPLAIARELLGDIALGTLTNDAAPTDQRRVSYTLENGDDGATPDETSYGGDATTFRDYIGDPLQMPKNGLLAFEPVEDISIVAAPGYSANYAGDQTNRDRVLGIQNALINHAERMRYRIAVLDSPPKLLVTEALEFRNQRSSKYAALYYPWVVVADPLSDGRLSLPPSGFVAGIYARNDIDHAVFKAPANEVVRLAIDFEQLLSKPEQEVLNPQGVNCFRFFPGRGHLLWGARTISDDPEWKYVNLRRYFAYLEHSIDRGTQWVVFENNGTQLWRNVRQTVEDFLFNEWKMGALLGDKPEQAFFVRCDRSTMTQNDLDNGRLICLIGVAPVRPAEFVIFRIGQWTASSNQ